MAHFARCPECGRLLVIDHLNYRGRCVEPCPGIANPPRCPCGELVCEWNGKTLGWGDIARWSRHAARYLRM